MVSSSLTFIYNQERINLMSSNHIRTLNKFDSMNRCKSKSMFIRKENIGMGEVTKVKSETPKQCEINPIK